jgi:aminoglycoside 6-adenylyltransferase
MVRPAREVLETIIQWAKKKPEIRAVLLTSTRAVPNAPVDVLSDYDVILILEEIRPFVLDKTWLNDFGEVLVVYWDAIYPHSEFGDDCCGNVTQYVDGLKIDFTLWSVELLQKIVDASTLEPELDAGYKILLDKDKLTTKLQPPSFQSYLPKPPTLEAYQTHINDFLTNAPYVAKCLKRSELFPLKWALDYDMKHVYLRQMLEWYVGVKTDWKIPVGSLGKGLTNHLPPDVLLALQESYAGAGIEENWKALFKTLEVFRRVASEVGQHLDYVYPEDLHARVIAYIEKMNG